MTNRRRDDRRSPEAEQYRKWYKSDRWKRTRKQHMSEHPLCARCLKRGRLVAADVVHHVTPHRGDKELFFNGPFESSCFSHHDSDAQQEEKLGYSCEVGADGFYVDPRHPSNRAY